MVPNLNGLAHYSIIKPTLGKFVTSVFWKLTNEISEWYHVLYILINIYFIFEYFGNVQKYGWKVYDRKS